MLALLTSSIGRWLIAMAAGAALLGGVWLHGYRTAAGACEADQLRTALAAKTRDLDIANAVAEGAKRRAAILDETLQANQDRINDYEAELAKRPDARCTLTDGDVRGVRGGAR